MAGVLAAAMSTGAVVTALPATAATALGGVNLQGYCANAGYDGARLVGTTPADWRCYTGATDYSIDINAACDWQYNVSNAYASSTNGDPFSWICWQP